MPRIPTAEARRDIPPITLGFEPLQISPITGSVNQNLLPAAFEIISRPYVNVELTNPLFETAKAA
jgi:hypothetical protein